MANGQLIADRSPSVAGTPPKPFYRLNIIDNGDGTCSVYVEDRANSDGVSTPGAVPTTGLQIKGSASSTPPGGSNQEIQFNNNGVFGGISGATYDGLNVAFEGGLLFAIAPTLGGTVQVGDDGFGNLGKIQFSDLSTTAIAANPASSRLDFLLTVPSRFIGAAIQTQFEGDTVIFFRNDGVTPIGRIQSSGSGIIFDTTIAGGFATLRSDAGNVNIEAPTGNFTIDGTPGVSGSFTTADAKTVTVTKGIITSIV